MNDPRPHWDEVYRTRAPTEVSWYQPHPTRSLALIRSAAPDAASPIIDVGCGAGVLLGELADLGYRDLTGLDTSQVAIAEAKARLGEKAAWIAWVVADIAAWTPSRTWRVWHDRAVFHFLIEPAAQQAYLTSLERALLPGATAIIATFALDGPERCSGLPVERYSGGMLAARLGPGFALVEETAEAHVTPKGGVQRFTYASFTRR
jgi:SAM-dependent methyltransferase